MKVDFNFNEYILQMSDERLVKFSQDSGTTPNYIKRHLIYKKKIPRPEMIDALVFKDNASVTRIIEILVQLGYLSRNINETDRRKTNLEVTEEGKQIIQNVQSLVHQNRQVALNGISETALQNMNQTLTKIIENCP